MRVVYNQDLKIWISERVDRVYPFAKGVFFGDLIGTANKDSR